MYNGRSNKKRLAVEREDGTRTPTQAEAREEKVSGIKGWII